MQLRQTSPVSTNDDSALAVPGNAAVQIKVAGTEMNKLPGRTALDRTVDGGWGSIRGATAIGSDGGSTLGTDRGNSTWNTSFGPIDSTTGINDPRPGLLRVDAAGKRK
jgi:hypothetical protein